MGNCNCDCNYGENKIEFDDRVLYILLMFQNFVDKKEDALTQAQRKVPMQKSDSMSSGNSQRN